MPSLLRHAAGSLLFGFSLIFAFALFVQLVTDFLNWIFAFHIRFMFPLGLASAFNNLETLFSVLTSLSFTSLIAAAIFFVVKLRRRRGIFDWADDSDQDS